jgi:hypothetical protein
MSDAGKTGLPPKDDRLTEVDVLGKVSSPAERAEQGKAAAIEAGQRIAQEIGHLDRRELHAIVQAFQSQLLPARKPGRRRNKEITAAHTDWKSGLRGVALYQKHIHRFDQLSRWKRQAKIRASWMRFVAGSGVHENGHGTISLYLPHKCLHRRHEDLSVPCASAPAPSNETRYGWGFSLLRVGRTRPSGAPDCFRPGFVGRS